MNYYHKFKKKIFHKNEDSLMIENLIKELLPNKKINYNLFQNFFVNYKNEFLNKYLYYILPLEKNGLKINNIVKGNWRNDKKKGGIDQDIIIAKKI